MRKKKKDRIPDLLDLLCKGLQRWGEEQDPHPIGDLDKAAAALKKLQEIRDTEWERGETDSHQLLITHYIPRAKEGERE